MDLPRVACISDPRTILGLIVGNLLIFVTYCGIPLALYRVARGVRAAGQQMPEHHISRLFKAFIFACGTTHLLGAVNFFVPWFHVENLLVWVAAIVSLATLVILWREVPHIVELITGSRRLSAAVDRHTPV